MLWGILAILRRGVRRRFGLTTALAAPVLLRLMAQPRVIKACPANRHVNTSSRSPRVPLRLGGAEGSAALPP